MSKFTPFPIPNPVAGWCADIPGEKTPAGYWPVVDGARFYNNRIEKVRGWRAQGRNATGQPGLICRARFQDGTDVPIVATDRNIYKMAVDGSLTALNGAPYAANPGVRWESDSLPNAAFFTRTDGALLIQKWDQANFGDLSDAVFGANTIKLDAGYANTPKGKTLQQYANHIRVGCITNDGAGNIGLQSVAGSGIASGALPNGENNWVYSDKASDAIIEGFFAGNDPVQRILRISDSLAVYKENSIQLSSYIGGDSIYLQQQPVAFMGTPSPASVVGVRGMHYFVGQEGIYRFNGASIEPVGMVNIDGKLVSTVYQTFLSTIMPANPTDLWAFHDVLRKEIMWVGQNNRALVYNYDNDTFSTKYFPFAAAGYVNLTQQSQDWQARTQDWAAYIEDWFTTTTLANLTILGGDATGKLFVLHEANAFTADGVAIPMTLESPDLDFGDVGSIKMVNELRIDGIPQASPNETPLKVQVGVRDNLTQEITWSNAYPVSGNRVTFSHSGRFIRFRLVKQDGFCSVDRMTAYYRFRGRN